MTIAPVYGDMGYYDRWNPETDYRANPHLYEVGRGQQGVLICQPYKSEILPHWRFRRRWGSPGSETGL